MESLVTALTTALTASTILGVVEDLVPFIAVMVPISLGIYFLRKLVKGAGKGKIKF